MPFVSNSDEVTMSADRTAATLVDDTLALTDASGIHSGVLDMAKISYLIDNVTNHYDEIRTRLGLNISEGQLYSLEVIITYQDGTVTDIVHSGETVSSMAGNVGQSKRYVLVRDPANPGDYPGRMAILKVRVW